MQFSLKISPEAMRTFNKPNITLKNGLHEASLKWSQSNTEYATYPAVDGETSQPLSGNLGDFE